MDDIFKIKYTGSPEEHKATINRGKNACRFIASSLFQSWSDLTKIGYIYTELDAFTPSIQAQSVCAKSCAHCCKIPLEILPSEARFIKSITGAEIIPKKSRTPVDRAALDYCPFLDRETHTCKVYLSRPFNCRAFFAFISPGKCEEGGKNITTGGPGNGYGSPFILLLSKALVEAEIGHVPGLMENKITKECLPYITRKIDSRVADIREFFGADPL